MILKFGWNLVFSIWPPADTMKRTIAKWATITGVMFGLQYISNLKHPITYIVEKPLSLVFFLLLLRSFNMYHTHRDNNEWVAKAQDVSWFISTIFSSNQWSKRSRSHYARLILDLEKSLFMNFFYYIYFTCLFVFVYSAVWLCTWCIHDSTTRYLCNAISLFQHSYFSRCS